MKNYEIVDKLKNAKKIIVTISDFGHSKVYGAIFPYFNVYVERQDDEIYPIIDQDNPYWCKKKQAYGMNVYGTNRVFELIYSFCSDCKEANDLFKKVYRLF